MYREPLCMGRKPATMIKRNIDRRAFTYHATPNPWHMPNWAFNATLLLVTAIGLAIGAYGISGL